MAPDEPRPSTERIAFRTCPLCEATCGLEITVRGDTVVRIRGDRHDVFSAGFICPKGSTLKQLHDDPDRLRGPLVRRDGVHVEVSWAEAWAEVERRLTEVIDRHGRQAIATYHGNPVAHSLGAMLFGRPFSQALANPVRFTASTVDQWPRQVAAGHVFGSPVAVPVPDLDRTDLLVVIGANPMVSNGSLCTTPDVPGRLAALRARGGTLVVLDPVRTRTAQEADWWLPIRPGTDALALAAVVNSLAAAGRIDPGEHLAGHVDGLDEAVAAVAGLTAESVADVTGIPATDMHRLAGMLADAPSAVVYGRIGTTTAGFGTVTSWLIDLVNTVTGNLDRPGGAMFAEPAASPVGGGSGGRRGFHAGSRRSRVSGHPVVLGEHPAAAMAEEIVTPGEGQLRALITVAGNPVLSTPHGAALDAALDELELMIAVDIYLNETTRHADIVLPPPSALQRSHFDAALAPFFVRNVANYSPAVLPLEPGRPDEWEILAKLALIAQGAGAEADPDVVTGLAVAGLVRSATQDDASVVAGRDPDELIALIGDRRGPEALLDVMVQLGPYGAAFGARPDGLTLDRLIEHPHGIDLGPLRPRLPGLLRTASGRVELAPPAVLVDLERVRAELLGGARQRGPGSALLVGRRHLRSNNSWMHNVSVLVSGRPRCTLLVHPDDAAAWGVLDGGVARVTSRVGSVEVPVEVTDEIRPGVVSLPHGWGHGVDGTRLRVAAEHAGVNSNLLTDDRAIDPLSATSTLNAIPVQVSPVGGR